MIKSLAYLGVNSPRAADWRRYGPGFVGAELAPDGPGGAVRLRLDDADWRLEIRPAENDSVAFIGWQVEREEDLDLVVQTLAKAGVSAERGSKELAQERHVNQLVTFTDPWGFPHEVIWGQHFAPATFRPGRASGGFVTGEQGLGHILLVMPDIEAGHDFFSGVLGFELSDKIIVPEGLNSRFYHANKRHHTLALGESGPGVAGLHHLMVQVKDMDDVGKAYDLLEEFDVPLTSSLGRHTNDQTFSFYSTTPSLFHIEIGFGAIELDDAWVPQVFTKTAIWGHKRDPEAKTARWESCTSFQTEAMTKNRPEERSSGRFFVCQLCRDLGSTRESPQGVPVRVRSRRDGDYPGHQSLATDQLKVPALAT